MKGNFATFLHLYNKENMNQKLELKHIKHEFRHNFGIELEFTRSMSRDKLRTIIREVRPKDKIILCGWERNQDNKEWVCKTDASCGYEIASPVFKSHKDFSKIEQVVSNLKKNKASISRKCGTHVHVESKNITTIQLGKIVAYWIKFEPIILSMFPEHRRENSFCKPVKYKTKIKVKNKYSPRELVGLAFINKNKTLNIRGYREKGTIEFRLMEATLDPEDIVNWSRFCIYFTNKVKNMPMPEDLKNFSLEDFWNILELSGEDKYCFRIYSKELNNMRLWLLRRIRKYSHSLTLKKEAKKIYSMITEPIF